MGMPTRIRAFVNISSPDIPGLRTAERNVRFQNAEGHMARNTPDTVLVDVGKWGGQTGLDLKAIKSIRRYNAHGVPAWQRLKMKQGDAQAIYFEVKIAFRNIVTRDEEKFHATIVTHRALVLRRGGAQIAVSHLKCYSDALAIPGQLEARGGSVTP